MTQQPPHQLPATPAPASEVTNPVLGTPSQHTWVWTCKHRGLSVLVALRRSGIA